MKSSVAVDTDGEIEFAVIVKVSNGDYSGTITIQDNASPPTQTITLFGTGD